MAQAPEFNKLAIIGCGNMGGGMALLFAENGLHVSLSDPSETAIDYIIQQAKKTGIDDHIHKHKDYKSLCESLGSPKLFVFSLPHGAVGDAVLDGLMPFLKRGDIILDCANEHWENTERRQGKCVTKGIRYIGCGVSGGYQAARRGPSMCPGSDNESLEMVLPLLRKVAAKDSQGRPCVGKAGLGGAGHYVKMIHNGIEHGMMSAISEAWGIMVWGLGMDNEEVGATFEKWNEQGGLRGTFLIDITSKISRTTDPSSNNEYVLNAVMDKVVQDVCGEEGTGVWSNEEAVSQHVAAPTLTTSHFLRLASAYRGERARAKEAFGGDWPAQKLDVQDKAHFLEDLRMAVYTSCLAAFAQGLNIIESANQTNKWCIDYAQVLQIWRAGCIIQADGIEELIRPVMEGYENGQKKNGQMNLLFHHHVAKELKSGMQPLKQVVLKAIAGDHVIPALGATLDYLKYSTSLDLPTQMTEAQLDYFGKHMYDKRGDLDTADPIMGKYHFEWKPA
ncbi:MAG: hypothetical protein M1821_002052 [Bathelium mastoideum]|nr:MAG: hypothetical protein M1821_002052 [Bathelium mastoideum]